MKFNLNCHSALPPKPKAQPGWFEENKESLILLMNSRNIAMENVLQRRTRQTSAKLKEARKKA